MTRRPRILLTRKWPSAVESRLAADYDATFNVDDTPMSSGEIGEALKTHDAVCPTVSDALPPGLFCGGTRCGIVGNFGVGVDHIALDAAKAAGIVVTNTPGVLTDCTADLALTLILMLARRAGEGEREVRGGEWTGWRPTHMMGACIGGKTLGIVGMGRIGRATARRARAGFGMDIVYYNRSDVAPDGLAGLDAHRLDSIEAVCDASDIVSLHIPGGGANRHAIGADALSRIGPGGFLINTARGDVLDQDALVAALAGRRLGGAGLDVYQDEPRVPAALLEMQNVVLLPHLGSATVETRQAMGMTVADALDDFFAGRRVSNRVA